LAFFSALKCFLKMFDLCFNSCKKCFPLSIWDQPTTRLNESKKRKPEVWWKMSESQNNNNNLHIGEWLEICNYTKIARAI
jgi:hypothetical protein